MRTATNTVCLCGSTRFMEDFHEANMQLSRRGFSVITISMALPKNSSGGEDDRGLKARLDLVHLNKILRSDGIVVVGDGYIGESTSREIVWADMQAKTIVSTYLCKNDFDLVASQLRIGRSNVVLLGIAYHVLSGEAAKAPSYDPEPPSTEVGS